MQVAIYSIQSSSVCAGSSATGAAIAKNVAFKEELTATLLQLLRQHPRASTPVPQAIPGTDQANQQGQEVTPIAEGAAYSQSIAELTDWLGCAKIALQVQTLLAVKPGLFLDAFARTLLGSPMQNLHQGIAGTTLCFAQRKMIPCMCGQ